MVGLGLDDDWPALQDVSSNSSDMMDTADDILLTPPLATFAENDSPEFDPDPGMFL